LAIEAVGDGLFQTGESGHQACPSTELGEADGVAGGLGLSAELDATGIFATAGAVWVAGG
jgi:hypothetical protein